MSKPCGGALEDRVLEDRVLEDRVLEDSALDGGPWQIKNDFL